VPLGGAAGSSLFTRVGRGDEKGRRAVMESVTESVMEPSEPVLSVELQTTGTACRLVLRGDLCNTSLAALEAQVDQLGAMSCQDVIVDLRSLVRLDAVGANVLLGLYYYVIARGGAFHVTEAPDEVEATLRAVTGALIPTCEEARSAVDGLL
jgi:anti-anti-sigma factor